MLDIESACDALTDTAHTLGITIFEGSLDIAGAPTADWEGSETAFLKLAHACGVNIVYLEKTDFDFEAAIENSARNSEPRYDDYDDLRSLLAEATAEYQTFSGQPALLKCSWFLHGVAHTYQNLSDRLLAFTKTVEDVAADAKEKSRLDREEISDEEGTRFQKLALELAKHERYADASSESKRIFMAQQLFPDEDDYAYRRIAELAALHHWWSIEPKERQSNAEKAIALHNAGQPIRTIAATLKISEAKVKEAIYAQD